MERIELPARPDWKKQAEKLGFGFHTMYGEPYWDETRAYVFSLRQVEDEIEDASQELYEMCLKLVDRAVDDEELLTKIAIPAQYHEWIRQSWRNKQPALYGRFDLMYDGTGPAKMLEFNADTPTALYETGYFQWLWLDQQKAARILGSQDDQYNAVQDMLIDRLGSMFQLGTHIHFASSSASAEDRATVRYLEDCATQAGLIAHFVAIEDIGLDHQGRFTDGDDFVIDALFKLYPYEDMFREDYGPALVNAPIQMIEPPWKAILSNKAILPLLWEMFPEHPNLLPAWFDGEAPDAFLKAPYIRKPFFSREGANIETFGLKGCNQSTPGDYGVEGHIVQAYAPAAKFGDDHVVIGSWIVGDEAAGMCIREDRQQITQDLSRFVPHIIRD